ncbi:MAG: hypothetical protein M1818_007634 [Claussenomyces sp. TS43310]|nr:MAG: hypothetical protein M1818_007634 [Claussenomyces sp. TS43310]
MAEADFTETNRAHWNKKAASYSSSNEKTISQLVAEIQSRKDWIGAQWVEEGDRSVDDGPAGSSGETREVRLLDYACGPGMVSRVCFPLSPSYPAREVSSPRRTLHVDDDDDLEHSSYKSPQVVRALTCELQALAPYITQSIGIDLSENMVEQYNTAANNQGLSTSEMHAVVGNLLNASDPSPPHLAGSEYFNFDIAAVGLGFHHFEDPILAARRLGERLKSGGTLMILDFVPHEHLDGGHDHGHGHGHGHGHDDSGDGHRNAKGEEVDETTLTKNEERETAATVRHHGFSEEDVRRCFEEASVGRDFAYDVVEKQAIFKTESRTMVRNVFLARGTKV